MQKLNGWQSVNFELKFAKKQIELQYYSSIFVEFCWIYLYEIEQCIAIWNIGILSKTFLRLWPRRRHCDHKVNENSYEVSEIIDNWWNFVYVSKNS